jgi:hypothetical protein
VSASPRRRANALAFVLGIAGFALAATTALAAESSAVRFVTPKAGATTGSNVTFSVKLTNFKLDAKDVGKRKKANMGHLHFQMDGGKFDYPKYSGANGELAVKLGIAGKYSPAVRPSISYKHLPAGKHKLVVFLANNDHSATGAQASISFTVR